MKVSKYQSPLSLKPTQFSIGMMEIEFKVLALRKLSERKLAKYIDKHAVPVVISPWKELCIVDHHHFLFACWHADVRKVLVSVVKDYSRAGLSYHRFWQKMTRLNYAHPYDQFGSGPRSALYLPLDIRGMADDPYRSLAWMIRKEGGYENSDEPFAEFKWAEFFRSKRLLESNGRRGFHDAVRKGLRLARAPSARNLPGHVNRGKAAVVAEKTLLTKSKYVVEEQHKGPIVTRVKLVA